MPPNRFESEVESFLEGSHGDRTHIKRADHHTVTPLCGTLLPTRPLQRHFREKLAQHGPSSGASAKKLAQQAQKRRNWGVLSVLGELFRARTHTRTSRAKNFAHRTHKHGDIETNNTTAHPKQGTTETGITSAPENCTQNGSSHLRV